MDSQPGTIWGREPAMVLALVQAVIALVVAFGLNLAPDQIGAILAVTAVVLGLITLPLSFAHRADASAMLILSHWAQGIFTFSPDPGSLLPLGWQFKVHMFLGMTIFLLFPFSRLVHVWSGLASVAYLWRPYQVVRARRLNVPPGHNLPRGT